MRGCGVVSLSSLVSAAGGRAGNLEWLPEPAGSGVFCRPPLQRPDRGTTPGAAAATI